MNVVIGSGWEGNVKKLRIRLRENITNEEKEYPRDNKAQSRKHWDIVWET